MRRQLPSYHNPFSSAQEIHDLARRYMQIDAARTITEQGFLNAGNALLRGTNERVNLRVIFRWKMEAYIHRFGWVREFPDSLTDNQIEDALNAARSATLMDSQTVSQAFMALDNLPHVGVPVASAILTGMYPADLTIVDRQAYKQLDAEFKDPIPPEEYIHYLGFCREQARRLGVTLREYDHALWQSGSDASRNRCG